MTHARLAAILLSVTTLALGACSRGQAQTSSAPAPPASTGPGAEAFLSTSPQQTTTAATGTVLETMNAGGYTYCRLQTDKEEVWIAATEFPAKKGDRLTVSLEMPMRNFHSNTLNRDFPVIYFVPAIAKEGQSLPPIAGAPAPAHSGATAGAPDPATMAVGPIAPPSGGLSIADLLAKRDSLAGKSVIVRGRVVKVNNGIMDRNWFHLQDGSGSADKGTHDITITTAATVSIGDIVTVTGILATKKDFGAGYAYDAIIEQATVAK